VKKQTEEKERELFKNTYEILGLDDNQFGKLFLWHGNKYMVKYYNTRSKHYPVVAQAVDTGRYHNFPKRAIESIKKEENL
jgi:hypothetical protein